MIKTKIIPQYETKGGFSVKQLDIKYQDDPVARFRACSNKLKAVERSLNKSHVAFFRAEFLSYFE